MYDDYIVIGSAPSEEDCVQVGQPDYYEKSISECHRYIELLRKCLGNEPEGANLSIKSFPHDFGTYHEVVCYYNDDLPESIDYAYKCEGEGPMRWSDDPEEQKINETIIKENLEHIGITNGRFCKWNHYEDYDPNENYVGYSQVTNDVMDPLKEENNEIIFYEPPYMTYSDYSGSLVEHSNCDEFLEEFGDLPGVHETSGGYGTRGVWINIRLKYPEEMWETLTALEDYPCINDDALCNLEYEKELEAWDSIMRNEFINYLQDCVITHGDKDYCVNFDDVWELIEEGNANRIIDDLFLKLKERANEEWFTENQDRTIRIEPICSVCKVEDLIDIPNIRWVNEDEEEIDKPWIDRHTGNLFERIEK